MVIVVTIVEACVERITPMQIWCMRGIQARSIDEPIKGLVVSTVNKARAIKETLRNSLKGYIIVPSG